MTRARRGLFTRWEWAIGLLLLLALGVFAASEIRLAAHRTARAEVGLVLTQLRMHLDRVDDPRPFGPVPRDPSRLSRTPVPWDGSPLEGFVPPVPAVRGTYALEAGTPPRLIGWIDSDGDGQAAIYHLPLGEGSLQRRTGDEVY